MSGLATAEQTHSFSALGTIWHIITPFSNCLSEQEKKTSRRVCPKLWTDVFAL